MKKTVVINGEKHTIYIEETYYCSVNCGHALPFSQACQLFPGNENDVDKDGYALRLNACLAATGDLQTNEREK